MPPHVSGVAPPRSENGTPDWLVPAPLAVLSAYSSAASVAAPLLAGCALTLTGLILQVKDDLRWPDLALTLLVAATLALLAAVQFGVWAHQYGGTPEDIAQWLPGVDRKALSDTQRGHFCEEQAVVWRFRTAYHMGIVLLLAGLRVTLVPNGDIAVFRWVAIALTGVGVLGELGWVLAAWQSSGDDSTSEDSSGSLRRRVHELAR